MESVIHNNIEGFLLLLLSMWPILLVVFIGVAISFYTMLLRKTALACLLFALAIGAAGWSQQPLASGFYPAGSYWRWRRHHSNWRANASRDPPAHCRSVRCRRLAASTAMNLPVLHPPLTDRAGNWYSRHYSSMYPCR